MKCCTKKLFREVLIINDRNIASIPNWPRESLSAWVEASPINGKSIGDTIYSNKVYL
jgi:hypothetical protein